MADKIDRVRIKCAVSTDNNVLTFTLTGAEPIVFDRRAAAESVRDYAQTHGFKQAIADCGALAAGASGKVSVTERFAAMREKAEWFTTGQTWKQAGGGGSIGAERIRLINALIRQGKPEVKVRDYVGKLTTANVKAMLADARLKATLAEMDAEATAGIDTDALFDSMEDSAE